MSVRKQYKRVTRKLAEELAVNVLKSHKDSGGNADDMTVFIVYARKEGEGLLLTTWDALSNIEVFNNKLVGLLDTSGINRLVSSNNKLQYKTNLTDYLYKSLKREEKLFDDSKKRGRV